MVRKYDVIAGRYSDRYADSAAVADAQVILLKDWIGLPQGASVLEIGCADGFVTERLAASGYRVHAIDISREMVAVARRRLDAADLPGTVQQADVEFFAPDDGYDAVMAMMGNFFGYVSDPEGVLSRLADASKRTLIVDLNPRVTNLDFACDAVARAGFSRVASRPHFVPQRYRLGRTTRKGLALIARAPLIPSIILRRKFSVVVRGDHQPPISQP